MERYTSGNGKEAKITDLAPFIGPKTGPNSKVILSMTRSMVEEP